MAWPISEEWESSEGGCDNQAMVGSWSPTSRLVARFRLLRRLWSVCKEDGRGGKLRRYQQRTTSLPVPAPFATLPVCWPHFQLRSDEAADRRRPGVPWMVHTSSSEQQNRRPPASTWSLILLHPYTSVSVPYPSRPDRHQPEPLLDSIPRKMIWALVAVVTFLVVCYASRLWRQDGDDDADRAVQCPRHSQFQVFRMVKLFDRLRLRAIPNQRIVVAFGLENFFTTVDSETNQRFLIAASQAITNVSETVPNG